MTPRTRPYPWPPPDVPPILPAAPEPPTFPLPQGPCVCCSINGECFSLHCPHLPLPPPSGPELELGGAPPFYFPHEDSQSTSPTTPGAPRKSAGADARSACSLLCTPARCRGGPEGGGHRGCGVSSTGRQAVARSQQRAAGEDSASLHRPNPLLPLALLGRQALPPLMTTPPPLWGQGTGHR